MANYNEIDIAGLAGNMQAEPRVFAHHAKELTLGTNPSVGVGVLDFTTPPDPLPAGDTVNTLRRGACLYVGIGGDVKVRMESQFGKNPKVDVTFKNVQSGSFLPIQVIKVFGGDPANPQNGGTTAQEIIALF